MAILNPDHLFAQADRLLEPLASGPPRQVDLRRAISSAYYGLFHFALTALADEFVGAKHRSTARYSLVYRAVDHRTLKDVCEQTLKRPMAQKLRAYVPGQSFDLNIQAFATAVVELQEKRHIADYNPRPRFKTLDALSVIVTARSAIQRFDLAELDNRQAFLTLLLCPPR